MLMNFNSNLNFKRKKKPIYILLVVIVVRRGRIAANRAFNQTTRKAINEFNLNAILLSARVIR